MVEENNKLMVLINDSGLEKSKGEVLLSKFSDYFKIAAEWEKKAKTIIVTSAEQKADMAMARVGRLEMREKRLAVEKTRKELKEQSLREGKAIDGLANVLKALIEPIEDYLDKQERFVEIQAAEAAAKAERDRIEAELKAEADRIAAEKAETERLRIENEKLKKEAEERESKIKADKEKADKEKAEAEAKTKAEKDAQDKALKEAQEKAEADRKAREKAEAEKAESERKAKEAAEKALKEKEDMIKKAKEAQEKAEAIKITCPHCGKSFSLAESITMKSIKHKLNTR
jgi:DNA repair exonuclease SbcCD ATPase subunit